MVDNGLPTFVTLTSLSSVLGMDRVALIARLAEVGLCTPDGRATRTASQKGYCRAIGIRMNLWDREKTIAALQAAGMRSKDKEDSRLALSQAMDTVRATLNWSEIQEVLIARKAKENQVEARLL